MSQIQLRMDVWDSPAVSLNPKICEGHRSSKSPTCGSIPAPRLLLWSPWKWPCHLPPGAPGSSDGMVHKSLPTGWLPRAQGPVGLAPRGLTSPLFKGNPGRLSWLVWIYSVLQIKTALLTFTFPEEERDALTFTFLEEESGALTLLSLTPGCAVPCHCLVWGSLWERPTCWPSVPHLQRGTSASAPTPPPSKRPPPRPPPAPWKTRDVGPSSWWSPLSTLFESPKSSFL